MPLYDYDCAACGTRFEVIHGVHADPPAHCPMCGGGPVRKAVSAPAVHFKGSGWAKKERRAGTAAGSTSRGAEPSGTDGGSDGGSDSRSDSGSDGAAGAGNAATPGSDTATEAGSTGPAPSRTAASAKD